jgi:hypothetical protein
LELNAAETIARSATRLDAVASRTSRVGIEAELHHGITIGTALPDVNFN